MEQAGQADAGERWGDGRTVQDPRKEPAPGDPYNWRQMGFAVVIMLLMLAFVVWLIRRQKRRPR